MGKREELLGMLRKFRPYKYAVLVLALGVILLCWSRPEKQKTEEAAPVREEPSVEELEGKLENILGEIEGVGRVRVSVSMKSRGENVYASEVKETLKQSGATPSEAYEKSSEESIPLAEQGGDDAPLLVKEYLPEYRGAIIVCDGGGDPGVQLEITEAVRSLLDIPSDNISIIKMKP